jgi:uncharacterized coiled-coil DUF342 family protein
MPSNNEPEAQDTNKPSELDFIMSDIPDHLQPTSIIMEVHEQISDLRDNITNFRERDDELRNCIKDLKMSNKIYSCSYTLETLVEHLNKSLNMEDTLNEKVAS